MNKKVLKRKINFIKGPISNFLFSERHRRVNQYARYYIKSSVVKNTILYESRDGNSITDSPYAIFKYMLNHPDFKNYVHIWSVEDFDFLANIISKFNNYPNVKFVKRNSKRYLKCLATCEYLINNSTFQSFFIPKKDQCYINTWHGTPLKSMGFDIPGNPAHSQNVLRNFLSTKYILSPNFHTTKMFTDSYKLDGLYEGTIIEEGYPRIDLTLNTDRKLYKNYLRGLGIEISDEKENILYAPTWKGTNVSRVNNDVPQIIADTNYLEKEIGDKYNILIKVHPYLYKEATKYKELKNKLVPDYVDTNELLSTIDMLITDYSSIFFDFLVTDKPILFYTWDADSYSEQRGQYLKIDDLPGPISFNTKELVNSIRNISNVRLKFKEQYSRMRKMFTQYEDGKVTERIVTFIFNGKEKELNTIKDLHSKKEKILIYPGGMRNNGITTSFINLMNNIDYDKYDVSCFCGTPHSKEVLNNLNKVNKKVRFLFKPGLPVYNIFEVYKDKFIHNRGKSGYRGKKFFPRAAYSREHLRLFGNTHFDYVIDFSGYSLYWAKFLIVADAKRKICFMHNDLLSDSEKIINGRRPHRINLRGLFSIYDEFDKLVSVSKATMELNRKNLSMYADYNKFDYVLNSINPEKILQVDVQNDNKDASERNHLMVTENFKSRAEITNFEQYPVWHILPNQKNASKFYLTNDYDHAEIFIFRKAIYKRKTYYKFSYNDHVIGWISSDAVNLLPDSIISKKMVDKIAIISKPKGNHIWTKPYKIEGMKKVSNSFDYKGIIVDIDSEVKTQHSIYSRISINNVFIGWIDNSALTILKNCTITENMSSIEKTKINILRKIKKRRNYQLNKRFIDNIDNRILNEKNIDRPMFARIIDIQGHTIWTKAYPHVDAKKVSYTKDLKGAIVQIKTIHRTRKGVYYLFYIGNEKIGWLDSRAFKVIKEPTIIGERKVSKIAHLNLGENYYIWTKPYGLKDTQKVLKNDQVLNDNIVRVDKEVTTQVGTYSHIVKNNVSIGWVDNRGLKTIKVFGIEVDHQFIPEPSQENINFVNMGRLSPEKGQDNLIRAFAKFHKQFQNSKLYILGQGPLKEDLQQLINELNLDDVVYLLGQLENPFSFMKKCDCFVLSSHYEGQPMVLLEAMTLEMNIIATDIVANRHVLENGKYGLLVENSIDGLEKGLITMANKEQHVFFRAKFDYDKYNSSAMESFYQCLQ